MTEPNDWILRPATPADSSAMARVSVAAWRAAYAGIMPEVTLVNLSVEERAHRWRERLGDRANPAQNLVAEQMGAIGGFVSVGPARDPDLDATRVGELWALYLEPLLWGKGIGRLLFERGVELLRTSGFEAFVLWVLTDNVRARRFYERRGMELDGAEKSPVEDGQVLPHVRYRQSLR
jgi:GNAT superfamily N-acetyltransferase